MLIIHTSSSDVIRKSFHVVNYHHNQRRERNVTKYLRLSKPPIEREFNFLIQSDVLHFSLMNSMNVEYHQILIFLLADINKWLRVSFLLT